MSGNGTRIQTYEDFVKVHGLLLAASGLPRSLHYKLFEKLTSETFDGGAYFQVEPCEEGRQRRLVLTADSMPEVSSVFLVDHAWTFRLSDAYKQVPLLVHWQMTMVPSPNDICFVRDSILMYATEIVACILSGFVHFVVFRKCLWFCWLFCAENFLNL